MATATYKQKCDGARFIVINDGIVKGKIQWRMWDRELKVKVGGLYNTKRDCQNAIDGIGDEE